MCGIAGIFNVNGEPVSPVVLRNMTDVIEHRGPDGEGFFVDSFIGLGHRRLAIIDLSPLGHQPMATEDGANVIAYNGEVYNFQELRVELEALGHRFRSRTDTEVVLAAYRQWGIRSLDRLNGMFAFAVWDRRKQELFIARDRYGIKPIYYAMQGDAFVFGSEIKAILRHPAVKSEMDPRALLEYFTFQNIFTDRTLFEGVRLLPAGCHITISLACRETPKPVRWWDYHFTEPDNPGDQREYEEELARLFEQAVSRQLVADVDVGSYLSGGMDSGSITAVASRQLPYMRTFTCGFDLHSASGLELGFDERVNAELMSYLFKTEHYEMVLKAGDMERVMPKLAWHIEEPRVGQSYPNYYAAQLASKFVKVVLSGAGGDEMFGGYPWRYYRAAVNEDFEDYIDKYYKYWQRLIPNSLIKGVFAPIWGDVEDVWTRDIFHDVFASHPEQLERPEDYINQSLYFEAKTFLHGLLVIEDKLSMAHSLETRVPFLDNDLVDFAMKVPVSLKLRSLDEVKRYWGDENQLSRYTQKHKDGKQILRGMMSRLLPPEIINQEKQGFSAPDASWFKGESIDYVRRELLSPSARIYELMDRAAVRGLIDEHLEGRENRRLLIWSLLNVEHWMRQYCEIQGA